MSATVAEDGAAPEQPVESRPVVSLSPRAQDPARALMEKHIRSAIIKRQREEEKCEVILRSTLNVFNVSTHPLSVQIGGLRKPPHYVQQTAKARLFDALSTAEAANAAGGRELVNKIHQAEARHDEYMMWATVLSAMPLPPTDSEQHRLQAEGLEVARMHCELASQPALDAMPRIRRVCLQRALAAVPPPPLGSKVLADVLYLTGCFHLRQPTIQARKKAVRFLRRCVEIAEHLPGAASLSVSARLNLTVSFNRLDEREEALREAQQALIALQRLPPDSIDASERAVFEGIARYNLMCSLEATGQHEGALEHAREATRAWVSLPDGHTFASQLGSAEEDLKKAHQPTNVHQKLHTARTITSEASTWSRNLPDIDSPRHSPRFQQQKRFTTYGAGDRKAKELCLHGGRALDAQPTVEMRSELEKLGVPLPDDEGVRELAKKFVNWIEDYKYKFMLPPSHTWANLFATLDEDHSGFVSYDEMYKCVRSTLKVKEKALPTNMLKALWVVLDADHSNSITVDEMSNFFRRADDVLQERTKAIRRRLTGFTTKGAGEEKDKELALLNRALEAQPTAEMRAELAKQGVPLPDEQGLTELSKKIFHWIEDWKYREYKDPSHNWVNLFAVLDEDKSGFVSYDELAKCMRSTLKVKEKALPTTAIKALWVVLDTDNSNSITVDEMSKFFRRADDVLQERTKAIRRQQSGFTTKGAGEDNDKELARLGRRALLGDASLAMEAGSPRFSSRSTRVPPSPPKIPKPPVKSPRAAKAPRANDPSSMLPELSSHRGRATAGGTPREDATRAKQVAHSASVHQTPAPAEPPTTQAAPDVLATTETAGEPSAGEPTAASETRD